MSISHLTSLSTVHRQCAICAFDVLLLPAWNMHSCDVPSPELTILLRQSFIFICRLSFAPPANSSFQLIPEYLCCWVFFLFFFLFPFSCSEEISCKYLQGSALQYILLKFIFPSTHAKHLTKTAVLSYCPSVSCSYLVLPCLSESICCPIS